MTGSEAEYSAGVRTALAGAIASGVSEGTSLTLTVDVRLSILISSPTTHWDMPVAQGAELPFESSARCMLCAAPSSARAGGQCMQSCSPAPPNAIAQGCKARFRHTTTNVPRTRRVHGVRACLFIVCDFRISALCQSAFIRLGRHTVYTPYFPLFAASFTFSGERGLRTASSMMLYRHFIVR